MPSAENDRGAASSGFEPSLGSCNIGQEFLQRRGLCLPNRRDSSFEIHSAFTKMTEIVIVLASYFLGSVPSGFILGSMAGVDVRKMGSGNVGATNVARVLGKGRGALTLAADVLKGWLPVFVAHQLELNLLAVCAAGLCATGLCCPALRHVVAQGTRQTHATRHRKMQRTMVHLELRFSTVGRSCETLLGDVSLDAAR